jgi:hypothetical protein
MVSMPTERGTHIACNQSKAITRRLTHGKSGCRPFSGRLSRGLAPLIHRSCQGKLADGVTMRCDGPDARLVQCIQESGIGLVQGRKASQPHPSSVLDDRRRCRAHSLT